MKLTVIFMVASLLSVSAATRAQRVSLKVKNATLREVVKQLRKQADVDFLYSNVTTKALQPITIDVKNEDLMEVLELCFKNQPITFSRDENIVVIADKKAVPPDQTTAISIRADHEISGTVTDENGVTVPGATIRVKDGTKTVTSGSDGKYRINVDSPNSTLVCSFIGYQTQEIPVGGRNVINITLKEAASNLNEVVVVGYGTQKKLTVTGSVVDVKGADLAKNPVPNVTNTLQGRLPGLIASNRTGEPGRDDAVLLIRGKSTLGNNSPLIMIDGVEREGLGQIDANNIETITVLKDASAAIYGARAANGVILVTTKRGKTGKPVIEFSANQGFNQPTRLPDMMDAALYATVRNEADTYNGVSSLIYSADDIRKYADGSDPLGHPNTNWVKTVLDPWSSSNNNFLSVRGGTDKIKYFLSLGNQGQESSFKNNPTSYKQVSVRSNVDATITDRLTVSLDLAGRYEKRFYPSTDTWTNFVNILSAEPTLIATYPNGFIAPGRFGENPLLRDQVGYSNTENYPINTTLSFKYDLPFVEGLNLSGSYNYDVRNQFQKVFQQPYYYYIYDAVTGNYNRTKAVLYSSPTVSDRFDRFLVSTYNLKLNYAKTLGKHSFNLLTGWEQSQTKSNYTNAYRKNFASSSLPQINYGSTNAVDQSTGGSASELSRNNYFGRLNYSFREKYLAEVLFRYDGSPIFPEARRYGFFPGISLGYRISEEPFIKDRFPAITNMKLRASYGEMGNDRVNAFQYLQTYSFGDNYTFGGVDVGGLLPNTMPNPNITWEVAKTTNYGLDLDLWNGGLGLTFDYFTQKRSNILVPKQQSIPSTMGFPGLPDQNIGEVNNKGFELALTHRNTFGPFNYNLAGNVSFARNKIVFMDEVPKAVSYQNLTGHPLGSQLIYNVIGIFQDAAAVNAYPHLANAKPGDAIIQDYNGDGVINANDQYLSFKTTTPEMVFGLNSQFGYKNFDLSVFLQGQSNAVLYPGITSLGGANNQILLRAEQRWTPTNTSARLPRSGGNFPQNSTLNEYSAAFLRLKNIELGYVLPAKLVSRVGISRLRVYGNAYNVFTFSKLDFMDPEADPSRNDLNNYPQLRTFNLGVNLSF